MNEKEHRRHRLSRDTRFLARSAIVMGAIFLLVACLLNGLFFPGFSGLAWTIWPRLLVASFAMVVWLVILHKITYGRGPGIGMALSMVLAIGSGIASTYVTLSVVRWQKTVLKMGENGEFVNDLVYCICGIGLREEVIKLLFFLPFVPWLMKKRDGGAILLLASCVGLGFAFWENLGYLDNVGAAWGRFLQANVLHFSLTGVFGFALCRFLYSPRSEWERFLLTFIIVVMAHGLYDAFYLVEAFYDYSLLAVIVFALVAYHFFNLASEQDVPRQVISPLAVFVFGATALIGVVLIAMTLQFGFRPTFHLFGMQVLSMAPVAFLFINVFKNA
ncbi:MAG: PrsW family glutamic-type intramembrane protease [Verrucomicrobiota bacterium]